MLTYSVEGCGEMSLCKQSVKCQVVSSEGGMAASEIRNTGVAMF